MFARIELEVLITPLSACARHCATVVTVFDVKRVFEPVIHFLVVHALSHVSPNLE